MCPIRVLQIYLRRTSTLSPRPRSLFVSPRSRSRSLSKNVLSFFLLSVIRLSFPASLTPPPSSSRAHIIRAISTSAAFSRNIPLASILAAVTWSSSTVFTSFYLCDVQFSSSSGFSLGPVVAADAVILCFTFVLVLGVFNSFLCCFMVSISAGKSVGFPPSAMLQSSGPGITNICLRKCTYAYFGAITYVVCKYMFFGKHKGHLRSTYAKK